MTVHGLALLLGLFGVPAALATLGHRFRERDPSERRRFWGGVIGYGVGLAVTLTAMMAPPVWWAGGGVVREVAVHWSMLAGFLAGVLAGPLSLGRRRRRAA
jgi:hypothetical protein